MLAGCTSIPDSEFTSYRNAFAAAQSHSKTVMADYAAARQQERQLTSAAGAAAGAAQASSLETALKLSPFTGSPPQAAEDLVVIRLRAWDVLASYNEALAAVAAGSGSANAQVAVDGFVGALKNFPFDKVAKLGASATPYTAVAAQVVEWVQKEVQARRFKQAVLTAAPQMKIFHEAARADAALFYDARIARLREDYNSGVRDLLNLRSRFKAIVDAHSWPSPNSINGQITTMNGMATIADELVLFPPIASIAPPVAAGAAAAPGAPAVPAAPTPPAATETELRLAQGFIAQAGNKVEPIREVLRKTKAYRDLMDQYVLLLAEFQNTQNRLVEAVEKNSNRLPSSDQIKQVISNFQLAREIYTSTK